MAWKKVSTAWKRRWKGWEHEGDDGVGVVAGSIVVFGAVVGLRHLAEFRMQVPSIGCRGAMRTWFGVLILWAQGAGVLAGNGGIDPEQRFAWGGNTGWINAAATNAGPGIEVHVDGSQGWLSGFAWSGNIGWIKMGADAGGPYENTTAGNWGVNMAADGTLSGYAWGPNIGWIHFGHPLCDAAIHTATGEFSGHAWGANIGWIKLGGSSPDFGVRTLAFDGPRVEPSSGSVTGGYPVTISGPTLGAGDITHVTLCGVVAASITSQSATQVVVVAGAAPSGALGDVIVFSTSIGETLIPDAFTYTVEAPVVGPVTISRASNQVLKVTDLSLLANTVDPQGAAMTISWVSPASTNGGTVVLSGRWIIYEPPPGDGSPDEFTFRVSNTYGAVGEGAATVVLAAPPPPGSGLNLVSVAPSDSNTVVRFAGIPGRQYRVQMTTNLLEEWNNMGLVEIGGLGYAVFTNEVEPPPSQYYRTSWPE